jgi:CRP/FNR family transcriptional regulator, cyclic AMP receptor protein
VLVARSYQPNNLVRLLPASASAFKTESVPWKPWPEISPGFGVREGQPRFGSVVQPSLDQQVESCHPEAVDPLYLFACYVEWQQRGDTGAAWEIISAARSGHQDTRADALALLERSVEAEQRIAENRGGARYRKNLPSEACMRTPYGLEIIESCMGCKASREGFFCRFSTNVLRAVDEVSHHSIMPAGAVLFVEGQTPRGVFLVCSGKVRLSTTSREGRVLILKQAQAGEVLGLSAAISGTNYEMTAETASPCQLNFIGRHDFMNLLRNEKELGMHAAVWLSQEFQGAYRDIHDLVLARSSSGKLARLLLSCAPPTNPPAQESPLRSAMTHEEMAHRIGSSRETVTRLLSDLKKKRLIRIDGGMLFIRDRSRLEALAV